MMEKSQHPWFPAAAESIPGSLHGRTKYERQSSLLDLGEQHSCTRRLSTSLFGAGLQPEERNHEIGKHRQELTQTGAKLYDRIRAPGYQLPLLAQVCRSLMLHCYDSGSSHKPQPAMPTQTKPAGPNPQTPTLKPWNA